MCEITISSDGLTSGAADSFNVLAFYLRQGLALFTRRVQPSGVAFSLDSDVLYTSSNDRSMSGDASLRLDCFEVPSGRASCDHVMHHATMTRDARRDARCATPHVATPDRRPTRRATRHATRRATRDATRDVMRVVEWWGGRVVKGSRGRGVEPYSLTV